MEILNIIREKVRVLPYHLRPNIEKVITHLKVAENHYKRGKESGDEQFFTDVVCRCNHAFEGILKEAYHLFTGENPSHKRISDMEEEFSEKRLFNKRVLKLFDEYRGSWRNPSTHDHRLFFSEGEALMALLNVHAFVIVVLDQMIKKVGYNMGHSKRAPSISRDKNLPLLDYIVNLLQEFSKNESIWKSLKRITKSFPQNPLPELLVLGILEGFLSSRAPDLDIKVEPDAVHGANPDMIISHGKERVILELKNGRPSTTNKHHSIVHLHHILTAHNVKEGILLFIPRRPSPLKKEIEESESAHKVIILMPENE